MRAGDGNRTDRIDLGKIGIHLGVTPALLSRRVFSSTGPSTEGSFMALLCISLHIPCNLNRLLATLQARYFDHRSTVVLLWVRGCLH